MDLRTKLVFALVGVSLGSMLALGTFGYREARTHLENEARDKLAAVAESRKLDLESALTGWSDRVRLIGSRTQLRRSLDQYNRTRDQAEREAIADILEDARRSVGTVDFLAVFDESGEPVAASWSDISFAGESSLILPPEMRARADDAADPLLLDVATEGDGRRQALYLVRLALDGRRIGWLSARLAADDLIAISDDFTGLGESGETMIVRREGDALEVLHPVRHGGLAESPRIPDRPGSSDPARLAAAGVDTVVTEDAVDYRGVEVWAATRHLEGSGWGIVVKSDASEERTPIVDLRDRMVRLALSLAAFAILAGILLGLHLARPIHELADVVNRIRGGETSARARIWSQDEVGELARTFNRMADALTAGELSFAAAEDEDGGDEQTKHEKMP